MIDIDHIANLDAATGLPVVDHRSTIQRWLDTLDEGQTTSTAETTTIQEDHDTTHNE
jgi:hypothetical protein